MSVFLLPKRSKKRLLNLINACPVKKTNWRRKQRGPPPPQPCDSYLKCRESVYYWLDDEGFFWDPENLGSCLSEEAYGDDCGRVDDVNGRVDEKERKRDKQSHSARTRQMNIAAASVVDLWMSW